MPAQPRTCAVCPAALHERNQSGYCVRHHNATPEKRAKLSAAAKRMYQAKPELREQRRRDSARAASDPLVRERKVQRARDTRLWEKGVAAQTPEVRAKQIATFRARHWAWCPPHLRDEARRLMKSKRLRLAEVKEIIAAQDEAEVARFRRSIGHEA